MKLKYIQGKLIITKLKAKLEEKDTVQAQDQNEVDKFCSDFKQAVKKCPNLLKCLGYENLKHYVQFVLLESTCMHYHDYFYYSKFLKFYFILIFGFFQFPGAQAMRYSRRWISWCRYLYSLVSQQVIATLNYL